MCDKLVFDLAQEVEGTPNVFVRKDWINILDNQNQNYSNNQSIIDTSQLSNSNKYMSYREGYLSVPLTLTIGQTSMNTGAIKLTAGAVPTANFGTFSPENPIISADMCLGLKNWVGNIFHSITLDYNGTTIVQQTPYINMWNSFKLMTSLSLQDIKSQGATIGFYPDDSETWGFFGGTAAGGATDAITMGNGDSLAGDGTCNNSDYFLAPALCGSFNSFRAGAGNSGFLSRQNLIAYDPDANASYSSFNLSTSNSLPNYGLGATYGSIMPSATASVIWKSYISSKKSSVSTPAAADGSVVLTTYGYIQYAVIATIYLKHMHSFFNMCPLLKGVFMKLTLNINNASSSIVTTSTCAVDTAAVASTNTGLHVSGVTNAIGGVNPLMIAAASFGSGGYALCPQKPTTTNIVTTPVGAPAVATAVATAGQMKATYIANLSVGSVCLDNTLVSLNPNIKTSTIQSKSVYLYIPSYTFNPVFEQAYLSSPVKQIKYTDVYQYQVINAQSGQTFNNLITNGIANIKSVLILPYFSASGIPSPTLVSVANTRSGLTMTPNTGLPSGMATWSSPFDPAGCGCTSPLVAINNFNVQISGQNAIYNLQKYSFEQFNNQLYGQNAVNGGLTDGLTSGLVSRMDFDMEYCYYYVNVERMLPVEMSVPKSVQILGTNSSSRALDLYVFIEYGVEISIDSLSGARV